MDPASIPPEQLASLVLLNVSLGAQLGLHFMLVPSCFECTLRLGKGDAVVLLWVANKLFEFSRSAHRQVEVADGKGRGRWEFGVEASRFVVTVVSS